MCRFVCNICVILTTIILLITALVGSLLWLSVRPNMIHFDVTDANLTQFYITRENLDYSFALNVAVSNPNKKVNICYDYVEAVALFHDVRFGFQILNTFFQPHKSSAVWNIRFQGQQVMLLNSDQISEVNREKRFGIYHIDVAFLLKVRLQTGWFLSKKVKPKILCQLHVPLSSQNGTSHALGFQATKCKLDYVKMLFH
ncbi:NDR1/HIN1-like protein 10 [Abrus precatorius]|uniref:NDR1/HIN1-like protein 10 n=1 Tax=Abrus precatorius TaxID=3816 RepID=A0A8B8M6G7_ABRPR|nr:NDR1/HIN1-like protein 10 [Abrus precatorius]